MYMDSRFSSWTSYQNIIFFSLSDRNLAAAFPIIIIWFWDLCHPQESVQPLGKLKWLPFAVVPKLCEQWSSIRGQIFILKPGCCPQMQEMQPTVKEQNSIATVVSFCKLERYECMYCVHMPVCPLNQAANHLSLWDFVTQIEYTMFFKLPQYIPQIFRKFSYWSLSFKCLIFVAAKNNHYGQCRYYIYITKTTEAEFTSCILCENALKTGTNLVMLPPAPPLMEW